MTTMNASYCSSSRRCSHRGMLPVLYNLAVLCVYIVSGLFILNSSLSHRTMQMKLMSLSLSSAAAPPVPNDKNDTEIAWNSKPTTALSPTIAILTPSTAIKGDNRASASPLLEKDADATAAISLRMASGAKAPKHDVCLVSQCTPLRRLSATQYRSLADMFLSTTNARTALSSPIIDNDFPYAICEFRTMDAFSFHFPHTMQQLYRCWSWWRLLAGQKTPVLLFPHADMPPGNAFLTGFVAALQDGIGLQMIKAASDMKQFERYENWRSHVVQPRVPNNTVDPRDIFAMQDPTCPYYAFHQPDDARHLRTMVWEHLQRNRNAVEAATVIENRPIETGWQPRPRIVILNRHAHREWLNAQTFIDRLGLDEDDDDEIPIVFFNGNTTFADQVSLFHDTDIMISPHGAQLTGIAFMPDCGAVLEILPSGYYLPQYFGSLALASSLRHGSLSLTMTGDWTTESIDGMHNQSTRQKVRNKALCPVVDTVVDAVRQLIAEWKQCRTVPYEEA